MVDIICLEVPACEATAEHVRSHLQAGFPWHTPERPHPAITSAEAWWDALDAVFERAFQALGLEAQRAQRRELRRHCLTQMEQASGKTAQPGRVWVATGHARTIREPHHSRRILVSKEAEVTRRQQGAFARHWEEIAVSFLKLGATAYGGPAITGLIQTELQEKRQWVSRARFIEGVALISPLPGAGLVQLSTFLGYARGGWWGGLLGGCCFALPGIGIMLALTLTYASLGATPMMRGGLDGLGPVVLGIFVLAVYRLGRASVTTISQLLMAIAAAAALAFTPLGIAAILALAAGVGICLFHSPRVGAAVLMGLTALIALMHMALGCPAVPLTPGAPATASASPASPTELALFFFKVGALTFGGGSMMIAWIQDQVVQQWHWLTPQEFLDGLALAQVTPGPVLVVTAYVGYKVAGMAGAGIAATA
ncbi:MAG: chromate efflux transporter, partial [Nitrospinae bacterium]|nr:chromate efflux transporter [Nitrospinota bacterium]